MNKSTNFNKTTKKNTNNYSYNNNSKSAKQWEKDILSEFESWLKKEESLWNNRLEKAGIKIDSTGGPTTWGNYNGSGSGMGSSYYYGY